MGRIARCAVFAALATAATAGCTAAPSPAPPAPAAAVSRTGPAAFCDAVRANVEAAKPLNALNAGGPAPHPAEDVAAAVTPLRVSYQDVLDAAPDEVRADARHAYELAQLQLDIYERTAGDASAVATDPEYAAKAQEAGDALQRVQDYTRTTCG